MENSYSLVGLMLAKGY